MNNIYKEIQTEVERAKKLHPVWPADIVHQCAIIAEELGELIQAINNNYFHEHDNLSEIKNEAIQTAAMCCRFLETINPYNSFDDIFKYAESLTINMKKSKYDTVYEGFNLCRALGHLFESVNFQLGESVYTSRCFTLLAMLVFFIEQNCKGV